MKKLFKLILILSLVTSLGLKQNIIYCEIETAVGNILIELYPDQAPITVSNFLQYVDNGLYNNSSFFRVCTPQNEADRQIKIEVIQGGNVDETKIYPPIKMENTAITGIKHLNGTISMARSGPNTATSQFFICVNDQPELDYEGKRNPDGQGFSAFGKVIDGMDIVLKIQQQKNKDQYLIHPIVIKTITRTE